MSRHRTLHSVSILAVLAVAAALSFAVKGSAGLAGWGGGAAFGLLLTLASHWLLARARSARRGDLGKAFMAGMLVNFFALVGAILLVRWLWPPALACFALTTLAIYLAHRFSAVVGWHLESAGRPPGDASVEGLEAATRRKGSI